VLELPAEIGLAAIRFYPRHRGFGPEAMPATRRLKPTTSGRPLLTAAVCCAALAFVATQGADAGEASGGSGLPSAGPAKAQVGSGLRYELGIGVAQDMPRAVSLYCAAAAKGDALAAYRLGRVYAKGGPGVRRNEALAAAWFRRSAAQGATYGVGMLGLTGSLPRVEPVCWPSSAGTGSGRLARVSTEERKAVERRVHSMAPQYGLDPLLVLAVIAAESAFDMKAVSPKGAQGLMQLMPQTASRFGVADAFDPDQNLRGGMTYLSWLLKQFPGRLDHALAAYNAGEEAVARYQGIPPYAETREYVERVLGYYATQGGGDQRG